MKKIFTLLFLTVSLFATAQQNGAVEYMYIHRSNNVVDSIAVAEIDSVTFAVHGVPEIPDTPVTPQYEAVDLGLSVKWARCNIGATTETDAGLYFQWGDTQGYTAEQVGVDKIFNWDHLEINLYLSSELVYSSIFFSVGLVSRSFSSSVILFFRFIIS